MARRTQTPSRIVRVAAQRLALLRKRLDHDPTGRERLLIASVDGGYTNASIFKNIPERTRLIGRIRKDARLYASPPTPTGRRGRRRVYGRPLPPPEAIRQDPTIPWQKARAFAAGKIHDFEVKTLTGVRWRAAGPRDLRLVIIRPLAYRLTRHSTVLYRQPAYLICTDPDLSLEQLLQICLWRWEIEVNFRGQKTLLGMGQAQVRQDKATALVPAFIAAAYAYLLLSIHAAYANNGQCLMPRPRWQRPHPNQRITTPQMIALLRADLWGQALGIDTRNSSGFSNQPTRNYKPREIEHALPCAVLYA